MNRWETRADGIRLFRDSCQVYALPGPAGQWLVINAGTGDAAAHLAELGDVRQVTVLLTHHFRDHTAGANAFRRAGAQIAAPWGEREHLAGSQPALRGKQTLLLYDLTWDQFAPIEPVAVDRWMMDYESTTLAGCTVEVIPSPGVTLGAVTYAVTLPTGRRVACVGELMTSPGRVPRVSPWQYNYNDITGGENVLLSWDRVLQAAPELVLPSLGVPFAEAAAAVALLRERYRDFNRLQPGIATRLDQAPVDGIEEVLPRLFRAKASSAETHFIVGYSGRVLAIDYGYDSAGVRFPNRLVHWARRPLLHSVTALQESTGGRGIATVIPTHYHDDHVAGIPLLQRLYGTEVWAGENFSDLLARPADYDRPCLWPEPIRVTRRLPLGVPFQWEDVTITLHPMSGHTEFSTFVCLEFDGHRIAHTGDQVFFMDEQHNRLTAPAESSGVFTNHVYRNGLALGCYQASTRVLREFNPEIILSGHARPFRTDAATWRLLEEAGAAFDEVHRAIMPLGDDEVHFGAESQSAKLCPHTLHVAPGARTAALHGWVLNPYPRPATAEIRFHTPPAGWHAAGLSLSLLPREKRAFTTTLSLPAETPAGRQPIALDLTVDGRRFGQVAEAWVEIA
jgi:glyoxylase-like metal-dependent hydrolase (beta-lactamase superfamily II)